MRNIGSDIFIANWMDTGNDDSITLMERAISGIANLLNDTVEGTEHFPPTILFEEGWMLRLVLQWISGHPGVEHPLGFDDQSSWFSEASLPSAFLPEKRGDPLGEGYTKADGAIGQFQIGGTGSSDLLLNGDATVFKVTEAKMFSGLSPGVTRARSYNQAARNVACMAEIIRRAGIDPSEMDTVAFYVVAPQEQIDAGVFSDKMGRDSIHRVVADRVAAYEGRRDQWFEDAFMPVFSKIELECFSWESIIDVIRHSDPETGNDYADFYESCLRYNPRPRGRTTG